MTVPITLNNVVTFQNDTTAATTVNNNSTAITTAFGKALDAAGDQMTGTLDMNSNPIINLPAPISSTSPARLQDLATVTAGGTINALPAGGTTGQALVKKTSTDYDVQWSSSAGTVTSVGLALPADFTVTGSPVTTVGTLTAAYASTPTGTGALVKATSPTLTTPTLGAATATTINGNTISTGTGTLSLGSNTLSVSNTGTAVTSASAASGDLTGTYPGPTIAVNAVTNAKQAQSAAYTLKGNPTGTLANVSDFTIGGLTQKASPATTDLVLIQDQGAAGALKYATVSSIAAGGTVASVNGLTGALTIASSGNVNNTGSTITLLDQGGMANKFRNGTMDIWQRGTSITTASSTASSQYTADGWIVGWTASVAATIAVAQTAGGYQRTYNSMKITGNTNVTDVYMKQRIESYVAAPLNNQTVTFQAAVFNNTGASITPTLTVKHANAQDNWSASTTDVNAVSLQACGNSAWTVVSYTFAAPSGSWNGMEVTIDFGNNFSANTKNIQVSEFDLRATPGLTAGLQSTPPIPEMRPYPNELVMCQRYYNQLNSTSANGIFASAWAFNTTSVFGTYEYPVIMRVVPTLSSSAANTFQALLTSTQFTGSAIGITNTTLQTTLLSLTVTGATAGAPGVIRDAGSNNSFIAFSAEL